ncbi:MAG: glycosyltransferase family 2 protein [Armatimonadota bacterium]|nr:glycosyltransferase family 2 protein [Armatimonadota bacterium]
MIDAALSAVAHALAWSALLVAGGGLALAASAAWIVLRHRRERESTPNSGPSEAPAPPVSVILVATEEEADIGERLDALAALDYPAFEVIVVSNGPIGAPLALAMTRLQAQPIDLIYRPLISTGRATACYYSTASFNLVVIAKEKASVADALNAGLNAARSPYVCLVGPRTWLDRAALVRLTAPVMEDPDRVVLVAGIERVLNGCAVRDGDVVVGACPARPTIAWAVLDGLRRALFAIGASPVVGAGWGRAKCLLVHRREILRLGGVPEDGNADDLAAIPWVRSGLRSAFVSLPVAWTRVPLAPADTAVAHRERAAELLDAVRSWRGRAAAPQTPSGSACRWVRLVRGASALAAPLDVLALILVTAAFSRALLEFSLLLAVWCAAIVGRTAVSSAAILLHDVTPKRYPAAWDVGKLFLTAFWEPLVGRPLAAWWTLAALARRFPSARPSMEQPVGERADQPV